MIASRFRYERRCRSFADRADARHKRDMTADALMIGAPPERRNPPDRRSDRENVKYEMQPSLYVAGQVNP
jgi:hypothetical protein